MKVEPKPIGLTKREGRMKIEVGKAYQARFKNGITEDKAIVKVEKFISGLVGMEVKFEGYKKTCPLSAFDVIFERV